MKLHRKRTFMLRSGSIVLQRNLRDLFKADPIPNNINSQLGLLVCMGYYLDIPGDEHTAVSSSTFDFDPSHVRKKHRAGI